MLLNVKHIYIIYITHIAFNMELLTCIKFRKKFDLEFCVSDELLQEVYMPQFETAITTISYTVLLPRKMTEI